MVSSTRDGSDSASSRASGVPLLDESVSGGFSVREARVLTCVCKKLRGTLDPAGVRMSIREVSHILTQRLSDICLIVLYRDEGRADEITLACREWMNRDLVEGLREAAARAVHGRPDVDLSAAWGDVAHRFNHAPPRVMTVPIDHDGRRLGFIACGALESDRACTPETVQLLSEIAARVGLALHNAALYRLAQHETQQRDELLAIVCHDLGRLLNAVYLGTQMLLRAVDEPDKARHILSSMRLTEERMQRLIQDLRDLSGFSGRRLSLGGSSASVEMVVRESLHLFEAEAREKNLSLTCRVAENVPPVRADASRLLQILSNLIENSLKFTPAGGAVWVTAEPAAGLVRFVVQDTGVGIAPEKFATIFDGFWSDRSGNDPSDTGLGLTIVKRIVDQHGGRVSVASEVGRGCAVTFTLPCEPRSDGGCQLVASASTPSPATRS